MVELEEERREEEKKVSQSANLELRNEPIRGSYKLVTTNTGPAVATNICLSTDLVDSDNGPKTVETLDPDSTIDIMYVMEFGTSIPENPRGHVTWKNPSGEDKKRSIDLG